MGSPWQRPPSDTHTPPIPPSGVSFYIQLNDAEAHDRSLSLSIYSLYGENIKTLKERNIGSTQ